MRVKRSATWAVSPYVSQWQRGLLPRRAFGSSRFNNSFMPRTAIPVLAILATVAESTSCFLMLLGLKVRFAAAASGVLLFLFATAMTISGLEQFTWAVYVLATGGWMLSTVDASMLSLDALFFTKPKETSWKSPVATR